MRSDCTLCRPDGSDLYSTVPSSSTGSQLAWAKLLPNVEVREPSEIERFQAIVYLDVA